VRVAEPNADTDADWTARFEAALGSGDPLAASDVLRKTGEKGWVKKAGYDRAAAILERLRPATVVRLNWAERLMAHPRRVDKELATLILTPLARTHVREVARAAFRLAREEDWGVREAAATLVGQLLTDSFNEVLPIAQEWVRGPDSRARRAVVVGAKYAAVTRRPEWAEPLLDLIEPALKDHDMYVRKSLGPFAIGDQLVRSYPEPTLARLRRWMEDPDPIVRWNVAMAFAAASGARLAQRAPDILDFLSTDDRPLVRNAVRAARRRIKTLAD
jgi:hypothetical protein